MYCVLYLNIDNFGSKKVVQCDKAGARGKIQLKYD